MQQRRVGCALSLAARVEDQTGTGRCDLRGKKPAAGIALTMGIGFRAKRCFFKMVCSRQIRMQIRIWHEIFQENICILLPDLVYYKGILGLGSV